MNAHVESERGKSCGGNQWYVLSAVTFLVAVACLVATCVISTQPHNHIFNVQSEDDGFTSSHSV